jgi:WD40 repeat protein
MYFRLLPFTKWLSIMTLLGVCAVGCSAEPNPPVPPTSASIPLTTLTPLPTATLSPTPTPASVIPAIASAIFPVVSGTGVPDAAPYNPDDPGPYRVILLATSGAAYADWNERLPDDWSPPLMSETELVVLIGPEREIPVDRQSYSTGPDITAYQFAADIELREARTGRTVAAATLTGSEPPPLPPSAPIDQERVEGSHVVYRTLEDWLCREIRQKCWMPARSLAGYPDGISTVVALSPDWQTLAVVEDLNIQLSQVSDGTLLRSLKCEDTYSVLNVAFSPDGQTLASSGGEDDAVKLWQVSDGALLHSLKFPPREDYSSRVISLAFSPDGQTLAAGSSDISLRLWKVADGTLVRTLEEHTSWNGAWVLSLAFSPDGQILASATEFGAVRLWKLPDGALLRNLKGFGNEEMVTVKSVAFSPDGLTLASEGDNGVLQLWRVSDGALLYARDRRAGSFDNIAFSPDGRTLAAAGRMWRVSDGALLRTMEGDNVGSFLRSVAFSSDGQILAVVAVDGTVQYWQVQ